MALERHKVYAPGHHSFATPVDPDLWLPGQEGRYCGASRDTGACWDMTVTWLYSTWGVRGDIPTIRNPLPRSTAAADHEREAAVRAREGTETTLLFFE